MRWHRPLTIVAIAVVVYAFAYFLHGSPFKKDDRFCMLGTWTDESGEPGNSIRFRLVEEDVSNDVPLVKAYLGRIHVQKFHGEADSEASWNYGGWDPLVLNVTIGKRYLYAAIRRIDDDHILIRIGADPEELMRSEAIDHPETIRLTRTARERGW